MKYRVISIAILLATLSSDSAITAESGKPVSSQKEVLTAAEEKSLTEVDSKAKAALASGDIAKAIRYYEEFLIKFPNSYEGMVYLGGIYGKNGDFEKEVEICERAIHANPSLSLGYINLGTAQLELQKWQEAEKSFLKGYRNAELNKDESSLRKASYSLSNYYLASPSADNKKAIKWADVCISHLSKSLVDGKGLPKFGDLLKEDNEELMWIYESVIMNKAGAYTNMKNFKAARAILEGYLKKYPDSVDVLHMFHSINKYQ